MDSLKLKDLLIEVVEELKIARITVAENEDRIQQLVKECHNKERKLEEEALETQSLKDKHEETENILSKASDDKIKHLETEKAKLQLAVESWEKEMKTMKEEVRTLQLSKYNLERTVREQHHRLQTQGQIKTSNSEQVADIENRCKHLQKEMASYSDALNILKKEVTEAGVLNRMLASTNSHQKCRISSLRDELEKKQQDIMKLRVHVTEMPDSASDQREMTELRIEQLNKELKQVAQINQDLKSQLEETRLAHQVTRAQLQESQDLAQRCMASTKTLTERATQQEAQVTALTKECALVSEQHTKAETEVAGLHHEMDGWEAKKKADLLILEEETEKVKNQCSNLKKTVQNLEDINISWASKNQAMKKDMQDLKMELDTQFAELDQLKLPICKCDRDTQTRSSTNSDNCYASTTMTDRNECASILAVTEVTPESVKVEDTQTMEQSKTQDFQVEGHQKVHQGEERNSLIQEEDTARGNLQETMMYSLKDERAQGTRDHMDEQRTGEQSIGNFKDNLPIEDLPLEVAIVAEQVQKCKGEGDTLQCVSTSEEISQNQLRSIAVTGPSGMPGHSSDELCLNPQKDTQPKGVGTEQSADAFDTLTTTVTTLNTISLKTFSGSLEVPAKVNYTETPQARLGNQQLPPELGNNPGRIIPLAKEETSPPVQETYTDNEPDACVGKAEEARSHCVVLDVFGNQNQVDAYDEDIVIPSTYVEENSSRCRGEENGELQEREPVECDSVAHAHEANVFHEVGKDRLPGGAGTRQGEIGLSLESGQVSLKSDNIEASKTLPVFILSTETIPGNSKFTPTSKLMGISVTSEEPSTPKDISKRGTLAKSALSETDGTETLPQEENGPQDINSSQSYIYDSTDRKERPLSATNLCEPGNYNILKKGESSPLTTEPTFLQTPKRKHAPSLHQVSSPPFVPKPPTFVPDISAFSYMSNSEPLSSLRNIDDRQKHPLAKTKSTWSSPSVKKSSEFGSAKSYSSWKTLDQLRMHPQQHQSNQTTRMPVRCSHLPPSAQQLHQSLCHTTYSPTLTSSPTIHYPTSNLTAQQSTDPPRPLGLSEDSILETSTTRAKEIHRVMPRLMHGRSIIDRSSERDDHSHFQEKISSTTKKVTEPNPTSPKYPPVPVNLATRRLPPCSDQDREGAAGDAGGDASLFSDDECEEDMKDGVASQIDRIQNFLKKDRLRKRAKLE